MLYASRAAHDSAPILNPFARTPQGPGTSRRSWREFCTRRRAVLRRRSGVWEPLTISLSPTARTTSVVQTVRLHESQMCRACHGSTAVRRPVPQRIQGPQSHSAAKSHATPISKLSRWNSVNTFSRPHSGFPCNASPAPSGPWIFRCYRHSKIYSPTHQIVKINSCVVPSLPSHIHID